jgi:fumarylacetoacetate (FAA) hydrolase
LPIFAKLLTSPRPLAKAGGNASGADETGQLKQGRDGRLVVVSGDLAWCADATHLAPTLQAALDDWERIAPQLELLATDLEHGVIPRDRFHEREALAPLPRAYQWADGSAYVNHVALVRQARGAEMPASFWTDPLMYQGGSDEMLAPRDPIPLADEAWGCDCEAEVVVVTGDVPQGITAEEALEHILLVGLVNDVSLAQPHPGRARQGLRLPPVQARLGAVAGLRHPDELGEALEGRQAPRRAQGRPQRQPFGRADAGVDMTFDFGTLIAHLAKTRNIGAGSIIGSGTVSNRDADGGPGKPIAAAGSAIRASPRCGRWRRSSTASRENAVPQARRHGADLDGRRGGPPDLRRDRAEIGEALGQAPKQEAVGVPQICGGFALPRKLDGPEAARAGRALGRGGLDVAGRLCQARLE